jgi:hypothetical protein
MEKMHVCPVAIVTITKLETEIKPARFGYNSSVSICFTHNGVVYNIESANTRTYSHDDLNGIRNNYRVGSRMYIDDIVGARRIQVCSSKFPLIKLDFVYHGITPDPSLRLLKIWADTKEMRPSYYKTFGGHQAKVVSYEDAVLEILAHSDVEFITGHNIQT